MAQSESASAYCRKFFGRTPFGLSGTDPEFSDFFTNFAFDEVVRQDAMDDRTRFLVILATLTGCQGLDAFRDLLPGAFRAGLTAIQVREMLYQAVAYLGIGRVLPFLKAANTVMAEAGIPLPEEGQGTTTPQTRIEAGNHAQVDIFGEGMRGFQDSGPEDARHINRWLAGNCFGDYYTREGLDYRQREMITFCFLSAQGGCEPQLTSHAAANLRIGNDEGFLIQVISQALPYIGYPRSLNALSCLRKAAEAAREE